MRTMIKNTLKLAAAAIFLLAVGWSVILFNGTPVEPVKPAQADIAMLNFAPKSNQQAFVDGLMEMGMEEPRSYDWNGNKVFFSMMRTKDSPQQVLQTAHRIFRQNGLNKKSKAQLPPDVLDMLLEYGENKKFSKEPAELRKDIDTSIAHYDDFFTGGLVPLVNDPNYILMAGGTGHGEGIKDTKTYLQAQSKNGKNVVEQVKSMHVLTAERNPGADLSLVTAVWSDSQFDFNRLMNKSNDAATNPEFPSCPGCTRLMALTAESKREDGYISTSFAAPPNSRENIVGFYDRSLGARGWRRMDSSIVLNKLKQRGDIPVTLPADFVGYARADKFITLDVTRGHNSSFVQLMQTP